MAAEAKWWEAAPLASSMDVALAAEGVTGAGADLARSIYQQESSAGKNTKTSNAGAVGGMQVMPGTFREVADPGWDINNDEHNLRAGVRYAQKMLAQADGDPELAAVGYYAGPGGMAKARRGVAVSDPRNPNAPTSLEYGVQVASRLKKNPVARGIESLVNAVVPSANAAEAPGERWWEAAPLATEQDIASAAPATGGEPAQPERSAGQSLARGVGIGTRGLVRGLVEIPGMVSDAATGLVNTGLDAALGEGKGFRFQRVGAAADNLMTAAGLPQAQTAGERVAEAASAGAAGGLGMVGAGKFIAAQAGPLARAAGHILAAGPGLQTVAGATGGAGSAIAREQGAGAGGQIAAGLAGGLLPGGGQLAAQMTTRRALVGNEAARQAAAQNFETFRAAGVDPTLAQVTRGRGAQAAESLLAKAPGGAGVMAKVGERQSEQMAQSVRDLAEGLAPGADAMQAGEAITRGVNAFRDGVKTAQHELYGQLDQFIPAATPVKVERTQQALQALNEGIPGAPNISQFFRNGKLSSIEQALLKDLDAAAESQVAAGMRGMGTAREQGLLPYEALQKLRTMVGREISDAGLVSDVPRSKWRALYGALSEDLGDAAAAAGPQAQQAWSRANTYTRASIARLEQLEGIVKREMPEQVFKAALAGAADGNTRVANLMKSLPVESRREVAAAVLNRLGRATNSNQNAAADAFSSESFLTQLSAMSPAARKTIFGGLGDPKVGERVEQLAKIAEIRRQDGRVFSNPSGTAGAAASMATTAGIGAGIVDFVLTGGMSTIGSALAGPAMANVAARRLTNAERVARVVEPIVPKKGAAAASGLAAARAAQPTPPPEDDSWYRDLPIVDPSELGAAAGAVPATAAAPAAPGARAAGAPAQGAEAPSAAPPAGPRIEVNGVGEVPGQAAPPPPASPRVKVSQSVYDALLQAHVAAGLPAPLVEVDGAPQRIKLSQDLHDALVAAHAAAGLPPPLVEVDGAPAETPGQQPPVEVAGATRPDGWTAFPKDSGTLAVPRAEMPQIKAEHRGAMTNFMNARGIAHQEEEVPAASLKPTQAEFNQEKVDQAKAYTGGNRAILVSRDGHVLDGHHQWLAAREAGEPVRVIRLDAPIQQLMQAAHEFPSSTTDGASSTSAGPVASTRKQPQSQGEPMSDTTAAPMALAAQFGTDAGAIQAEADRAGAAAKAAQAQAPARAPAPARGNPELETPPAAPPRAPAPEPEVLKNRLGKPFTVRIAAQRAAAAAGEGFVVEKVDGGYIVTRGGGEAEGDAQAAAPAPAPTAPAEGDKPSVIRNSKGAPFTVKLAALNAAKKAGEGYEVRKEGDGYVAARRA